MSHFAQYFPEQKRVNQLVSPYFMSLLGLSLSRTSGCHGMNTTTPKQLNRSMKKPGEKNRRGSTVSHLLTLGVYLHLLINSLPQNKKEKYLNCIWHGDLDQPENPFNVGMWLNICCPE